MQLCKRISNASQMTMSSINTTTSETNQLQQTTTASDEYADSSSSSSSTSPSGTSTPRPRRSCTYGFAGCRGGRRCSAKGHPNEAAAVQMLFMSMTRMMRSQLEANDMVAAPVAADKVAEQEEETTVKETTQQKRESEQLPTYQAAVLGR